MTDQTFKTYREVFPNWADDFDNLVPPHMQNAVEQYILYGQPLGDFLKAFVSGHTASAMMRADHINKGNFENWCQFFYWSAPSDCHKNVENYTAWVEKGGFLEILEVVTEEAQ